MSCAVLHCEVTGLRGFFGSLGDNGHRPVELSILGEVGGGISDAISHLSGQLLKAAAALLLPLVVLAQDIPVKCLLGEGGDGVLHREDIQNAVHHKKPHIVVVVGADVLLYVAACGRNRESAGGRNGAVLDGTAGQHRGRKQSGQRPANEP